MRKEENKKTDPINTLSHSDMYDQFAPAMYGKILSIVHKGPIADKVLERVFKNAYLHKDAAVPSLRTPFIDLLNSSREESYKTLQALNLFRQCCEASGACVTNKKEIEP